jgi:hypothetical protein
MPCNTGIRWNVPGVYQDLFMKSGFLPPSRNQDQALIKSIFDLIIWNYPILVSDSNILSAFFSSASLGS